MIDPHQPDYENTPVSAGRPTFGYLPANKKEMPAVSVITPFYNITPTLFQETAQSIMQQSFQQWEWVIVNDGSTCETALEGLAKFRKLDPRIRVIDLPVNQGVSHARNAGFSEVKTDLIVMLDSDDLLEPTAVEKWLWYLDSHPEAAWIDSYSVGFGALQYLWSGGSDQGERNLIENMITSVMVMVRRDVWQAVGGFDPAFRTGCEDWDLWLRCADAGYWGNTIPEYLAWYRRRSDHSRIWASLSKEGIESIQRQLHRRYPRLYAGEFPRLKQPVQEGYAPVPDNLPAQNLLGKPEDTTRLLMLLPWMTIGGADKFNLDLIEQLSGNGYEISICTTLADDNPWMSRFAALTPDVFILPNFLQPLDYPRFLRYLIESRDIDVVMVSNSTLGYQLLPYLRSRCPQVTFVDYNHIEEMNWQSGGHPQRGVSYQEQLDLNLVASRHLKDWMVSQGAEESRIEVCYINVDARTWDPARFDRGTLRRELDVSEEGCLILYAGRICDQKRPEIFAQVIYQLANEERSEFVCLVAGDGPDLEKLKVKVTGWDLTGRVRFLGSVSPALLW